MDRYYRGNENLKRARTAQDYTKEQLREFIKCMNDKEYFYREYVKILDVDRGIISYNPYNYQTRLSKSVDENRFVLCKFPRQSGKTTCLAAYIVHCLLFKENFKVLIAAHVSDGAVEVMDRIKFILENLPLWLQSGIISWNVFSVELENGSKVSASATTEKTGRGKSINLLLLDEFAFVSQAIAENFLASTFPTLAKGQTTQLVIISTPNGLNHFNKMWVDANEHNSGFFPVEIKWNDVPGRDEKFREETIKLIGIDRWNQEFDGQFLGSQNTLISPDKLKNIVHINPLEQTSEGLKVYRKPEKDGVYMITVDVSRGKALDYHAFVVFDITAWPIEIVCTFKNNELPPSVYPNVIYRIGTYYNDAYVLVETRDNGEQIAEILFRELEYESMLGTKIGGRKGQKLSIYNVKGKGLQTSKSTKLIGCSNLKYIIEDEKMIINCHEVIKELANFEKKRASYEAKQGYNDDLVICLVNFAWATTQPFFKNLTEFGVRDFYEEQIKEVEENSLPLARYSDGMKGQLEFSYEDWNWLRK